MIDVVELSDETNNSTRWQTLAREIARQAELLEIRARKVGVILGRAASTPYLLSMTTEVSGALLSISTGKEWRVGDRPSEARRRLIVVEGDQQPLYNFYFDRLSGRTYTPGEPSWREITYDEHYLERAAEWMIRTSEAELDFEYSLNLGGTVYSKPV